MRVRAYAAPKRVLDAQADLGFAFVPESACESLLAMKGKALPAGSEDEVHRKTTLALACLSAIKPDLDAHEASKDLSKPLTNGRKAAPNANSGRSRLVRCSCSPHQLLLEVSDLAEHLVQYTTTSVQFKGNGCGTQWVSDILDADRHRA